MFRLCAFVLIAVLSGAPAHAEEKSLPYTVEDAFVRETPARITAGYVIIHNNYYTTPDRLLRVEAPAEDPWAKRFELHNVTQNAEGVLEMNPVDAVDIPKNGAAMLRPGGLHIMIYDITKPIKAGDSKKLVLIFEKRGRMTVDFAVKPITYTGIGSEGKTIPASEHHHH